MRALNALAGLVSRGVEDPSQPLTSGLLLSQLDDAGQLWSPGASGADPLRIGTALRCVQILASTVAGAPLKVFKRDGLAEVRLPALTAERVGTTPFELWSTVVSHMALRGNAYVRKVRTRDGRLVELVPIHPSRVKVELADEQDAAAAGMPYVKMFVIDGGRARLTEFDIMHIPALSDDGLVGISVIGNLRRMFETAHNIETLASRTFDRGLLLSGFLSTTDELTAEQAAILQARWRAKYSGIDNAFDVGVLDKGATFQQISMSPADAQFLETRKFQKSDITGIFGLPGWMLNDQEKSTSWGTGMEQQFIAFVTITLSSYFHGIEQRVEREICDPRTEKAQFKIEGLLRGDSKARAAFYASGIQHGWMVPNEPRDLEDMPRVAWGDVPYRPFNESAGSQADSDDKPGGDDDEDADA